MRLARLGQLREDLGTSGRNVKFSDLLKICRELFGEPRNSGTSHHVFKTPWPGDPRVNLQPDGKDAKRYQVRQVIKAIEKCEQIILDQETGKLKVVKDEK